MKKKTFYCIECPYGIWWDCKRGKFALDKDREFALGLHCYSSSSKEFRTIKKTRKELKKLVFLIKKNNLDINEILVNEYLKTRGYKEIYFYNWRIK